jgi:Zn-finger protein
MEGHTHVEQPLAPIKLEANSNSLFRSLTANFRGKSIALCLLCRRSIINGTSSDMENATKAYVEVLLRKRALSENELKARQDEGSVPWMCSKCHKKFKKDPAKEALKALLADVEPLFKFRMSQLVSHFTRSHQPLSLHYLAFPHLHLISNLIICYSREENKY